MSNIYERLKVKVSEDGSIINLNELVNTIAGLNMNDELNTFLLNLENRISNSNLNDKNILSATIKSKIIEYSFNRQGLNSNLEVLKFLKEINNNTNKLNIISTSNEIDGNVKEIEYLTYLNDDGVIDILYCNANSLKEFLKENAKIIGNLSDIEIFNKYKEFSKNNLDFIKININDDNIKSNIKNGLDDILSNEYNQIKDYCENYGINDPIERSIDDMGERLYRVKDGVFKFSNNNGLVSMEIIKVPSIEVSHDESIDTKKEEEELRKEEIHNPINNYMDFGMIPMNGYALSIMNSLNNQTYEEVKEIHENDTVDVNDENLSKAQKILEMKDIYDEDVSNENRDFLKKFIKRLVDTMLEREENPDNGSYKIFLDDVMQDLLDKYNSIQDGDLSSSSLNDEEKEICKKYLFNSEIIKNINISKSNEKKLELNNIDSNDDFKRRGMATIVMILEIMLLAIFIILFSSLDI